MRQALAWSGKAAVAKLAMRGRKSLVLVRAQDDVLVMHELYWPDEIRPPTAPEPAKATALDLMAALRASLETADAHRAKPKPR